MLLKQDSSLFPFFFILTILCCRITAQIFVFFFFCVPFTGKKREIADLPGRTSYPASFPGQFPCQVWQLWFENVPLHHMPSSQQAEWNYQAMVVQKSSFEQQNVLSNNMENLSCQTMAYLAIMHILKERRHVRVAALFIASHLRGFLKANNISIFKLQK